MQTSVAFTRNINHHHWHRIEFSSNGAYRCCNEQLSYVHRKCVWTIRRPHAAGNRLVHDTGTDNISRILLLICDSARLTDRSWQGIFAVRNCWRFCIYHNESHL